MAKFSYQIFGAFLMFLVLQPFVVMSRPAPRLENILQNFEKAQIGDTINGVNQVKKYLKAFGYYPYDTNLVIDDHFDNSLESALKAFQENYYLKVTGKIDHDTIKAMMIPRCGVPDIIRNKTSKGTNGTLNHNHGAIFHLVSNYSFFNGNPRWTRYQLTYNFLPDSLQVVNFQSLRSAIARAFQKWSSVSPFRFQEVAQGTRADIRIGFYRYDHGDGYPFDGPLGNVIAHAFAPQDGRFHYDADENWSFNPAPNQLDLESVAVHEIGHNLGLDHSRDQNAVMFPTITIGTTKRNLGQDDINGLRALYGY